jgi:hypothetical protein
MNEWQKTSSWLKILAHRKKIEAITTLQFLWQTYKAQNTYKSIMTAKNITYLLREKEGERTKWRVYVLKVWLK